MVTAADILLLALPDHRRFPLQHLLSRAGYGVRAATGDLDVSAGLPEYGWARGPLLVVTEGADCRSRAEALANEIARHGRPARLVLLASVRSGIASGTPEHVGDVDSIALPALPGDILESVAHSLTRCCSSGGELRCPDA